MFRSKIEVREYAMNKAIELMGTGTPTKQVVEKAEEIEKYIIGNAELPETVDEDGLLSSIIETIGVVASQYLKDQPANGFKDFLNDAGLEPMIFEPKPETKKKK